jgi:hypothetical protein
LDFHEKNRKENMRLIKKLLKWLSIFFLLLIGLAIIIPYLYKSEIIALIKTTANESITAELDFQTVDIRFLSTFPELTVEIFGLTITGKEAFKEVVLAELETTLIRLDFKSILFGDQYKVKSITIDKPSFHVEVNKAGLANYDIVKSDKTASVENETISKEETPPFSLAIESIEIKNASIIYRDNYYLTDFTLEDLNHSSSIILEGDAYFMQTLTNINSISLVYDGVHYLKNINTSLDCDIDLVMSDKSIKVNFKKNKAMLSLLSLSFNGWFEMLDKEYNMDLSFSTNNPEIKGLLSLVPGALTSDFNSVSSNGNIALNGKLKGKYRNSILPGFELNLKVENGWFKYPELAGKVDDINILSTLKLDEGTDLDNLSVNLSDFHASLGSNSVEMMLDIQTPTSDPKINASFNSNINLEELKNYIPIPEKDELKGLIFSDLNCQGNLSAIEKESYNDFSTSGSLKIINLNYSNASYVSAIDSMLFMFSNNEIILPFFEARFGQSDISASGKINNAVEYYFNDEPLSGVFNVSSTFINLDELANIETQSTIEDTVSGIATDTAYNENNPNPLIEIPINISFNLNCELDMIEFNKINLKNTLCQLSLNNGIASIANLSTNALGGIVKADGNYFVNEENTGAVDMNFRMKNISIEDCSKHLITIQKLAPVTNFCEGKLNTTFSLKSDINNQLSPIINTVNSSGQLTTNNLTVMNYPVLNKISEELNMNGLNQLKLKKVNINYLIENGLLNIDTFNLNLPQGVDAKVVGGTEINNEMNYALLSSVPTSLLANNKAFNKVESKINTIGPIPLEMIITGDFKNPKISVDFKNQANDVVALATEKAKEAVKEKASDEAEKLIGKAKLEADKIIATAKTQANKTREEGLKLANKTREETNKVAKITRENAYKLADAEVAKSKNILEKKAKQLVADKAKLKADQIEANAIKEGDKKANLITEKSEKTAKSIEIEAQQRANKVINEAQLKANKLQ